MMSKRENELVNLREVTKIYNSDKPVTAGVRNISLKAYPGELMLILGPSGSGKTTLLTLIAGLIEPTSGIVEIFGQEIGNYSQRNLQKLRVNKIGFVFQNFHLIDALTGLENISLALHFAGISRSKAKERAFQLMNKFSLGHLAEKLPGSFSHGEKQRIAILRAMANDAELILADEPTASLESKQGFGIIEILHRTVKDDNKSVIVVSHDMRLKKYADRIIEIEDGSINSIET